MGNETVPTNHGFLDGCYLHHDASGGAATLVSFHFVRYILFTVMLTIAGPLVYRLVAAFFDLERDFKSLVDHYDDITNGLIYSYIVFTLGNYSHTFSWVTLVFYFVGILGYSALVEIPFMRVSLPGWRDWPKQAWAVTLSGLAVVLVAAGFHIHWAKRAGILQWYLPLFVLATATVWTGAIVKAAHHYCADNCPEGLGIERVLRRFALVLFTRRSGEVRRRRQEEMRSQQIELVERAERYAEEQLAQSRNSLNTSEGNFEAVSPSSTSANADGPFASSSRLNMPIDNSHRERINTLTREEKHDIIQQRLKNLHYLNVETDGPLPIYRYRVHLHHWQIFYILAFFTRFDKFVSKMCAGLVLGIVTQGSAAYGFDAMMERKEPTYEAVPMDRLDSTSEADD